MSTHPLVQTLALLEEVKGRGEVPVVVFDLDHTLFDNGPRTWSILCEFAEQTGRYELLEALRAGRTTMLPYSVADALRLYGEEDEAVHKEGLKFWLDHFFIDAYIDRDIPLAGAKQYVERCYEAGATIVYLTGRDAPNMLVGTAASLRTHGFPVGVSHTVMLLKPDFETPDVEFKADVVEFIQGLGTVVASFDNEPGNCNMFRKAYPGAVIGFFDTAMAPGGPALEAGIPSLTDFRLP